MDSELEIVYEKKKDDTQKTKLSNERSEIISENFVSIMYLL